MPGGVLEARDLVVLSSRFGTELGEHVGRQVDPCNPDTASRERQGDTAGPDPELERRTPARQLGQPVHRRPEDLGREHPGHAISLVGPRDLAGEMVMLLRHVEPLPLVGRPLAPKHCGGARCRPQGAETTSASSRSVCETLPARSTASTAISCRPGRALQPQPAPAGVSHATRPSTKNLTNATPTSSDASARNMTGAAATTIAASPVVWISAPST